MQVLIARKEDVMGVKLAMIKPLDQEYFYQFRGIISAESQMEFRQLVVACQGSRIIRLDFSHVTRINSMGVALFLKCLKELKQAGKTIHISGANKMTAMLFKMMGIGNCAILHS